MFGTMTIFVNMLCPISRILSHWMPNSWQRRNRTAGAWDFGEQTAHFARDATRRHLLSFGSVGAIYSLCAIKVHSKRCSRHAMVKRCSGANCALPRVGCEKHSIRPRGQKRRALGMPKCLRDGQTNHVAKRNPCLRSWLHISDLTRGDVTPHSRPLLLQITATTVFTHEL